MPIVSTTTDTVIAAFQDHANADYAIRELKHLGFTEAEIGVVSLRPEHHDGSTMTSQIGTNAPQGAAAGAATGLGLGTLWGLGILAGVVPGIGPAIAGGSLGVLLSSAAVGAVALGFAGTLVGLGVPEDDADFYEDELKAGRTIVVVKAGNRAYAASSAIARAQSYEQ